MDCVIGPCVVCVSYLTRLGLGLERGGREEVAEELFLPTGSS